MDSKVFCTDESGYRARDCAWRRATSRCVGGAALVLGLSSLLVLGGCGQKGPLFHPPAAEEAQAAETEAREKADGLKRERSAQ